MAAIFGVWHRDASAPSGLAMHVTSGTTAVQVAFDGRLDNRAELLETLAAQHGPSIPASDAELVARLYAQRREAFVDDLRGDFALALHDARARRLFLARDAIGVRPLYYAATPQRVIFASSIQRILGDPATSARPNEQLLAGLMLQRLHRQDDDGSTFFEGINSVPASHIAICDADQLQVRQYWEFDAHVRYDALSFDDCAAALRSHLATAVERRLRSPGPVAIAVSGGVDSSAILCLARHAAAGTSPALAFTHTARDGSPADESAFIETLEERHGPIARVQILEEGSALDGARASIRRAEAPMLDLQRSRSAALMSAAARSGARVLMTGHWGDQFMFDQAYLVDALRRFSWQTVRAHLDEYLRWFPEAQGGEFTRQLVSDVVDHAAPRWVRPAARRVRSVWREQEWWQRLYTDRFRANAGPDAFRREPRHGGDATSLCRALYREARSKYHALCLETNSKQSAHHGLKMTFPFLDCDVVAFALGVPGDLAARGGVPKALLREAVRGIVPEAIRMRRTKGDASAIVNNGARRDFPEITRLLSREPLVVQFGYVKVDTMIAGLRLAEQQLAQSESCVAAWRLTDLVALELWLQEFFGVGQP